MYLKNEKSGVQFSQKMTLTDLVANGDMDADEDNGQQRYHKWTAYSLPGTEAGMLQTFSFHPQTTL